MPRKVKVKSLENNASSQEIRQQVRENIRDRYSVGQRWKCLEEAVFSEDNRRNQFYKKIQKQSERVLPLIIQKFIRTLKLSVRTTMRHVGGTPFSIIRQMFLHWDADKTGELNIRELERCIKSLGVQIAPNDLKVIIDFYDSGVGNNEMSYKELLLDLQDGEPGMLENVDELDFVNEGPRFETHLDAYAVRPPLIESFIVALRSVIAIKLRNEGGTPQSHIRSAFLRFDSNYANALTAKDFTRAMTVAMGLAITDEQAMEIVRYYDRKNRNELDYHLLLRDVCENLPGLMAHSEVTIAQANHNRNHLKNNPFIFREFRATANKNLESFKLNIHSALQLKVATYGGSKKSWLKDAFMMWDPRGSGVLSNWKELIGSVKRIGITLSQEEAMGIMRSYDKLGNGQMHYNLLVSDLLENDLTLVADSTTKSYNGISNPPPPATATSRTPANMNSCMQKFRFALDIFTRKSKGQLNARDVLLGTFIRFDPKGRVSIDQTKEVCRILQVQNFDADMSAFVSWFDTDGSNRLDYREFVRQLFGTDDSLTKTKMPDIMARTSQSLPAEKAALFVKSGTINTIETDKTLKTKIENMKVIESTTQRKLKDQLRARTMREQRAEVENHLASVEFQRQALISRLNSAPQLR